MGQLFNEIQPALLLFMSNSWKTQVQDISLREKVNTFPKIEDVNDNVRSSGVHAITKGIQSPI